MEPLATPSLPSPPSPPSPSDPESPSARRTSSSSPTRPSFRRKRWFGFSLTASPLMAAALVIAVLAAQTSAVLISTFDNCLPAFQRRSPSAIQFHPILVAAEFDLVAKEDNHLKLAVWGVVTGEDEGNPAGQTVVRRTLGETPLAAMGAVGGVSPISKRQTNGTDATDEPVSTSYFGTKWNTDGKWPEDDVTYNLTGTIVDYSDKWNAGSNTREVAMTLATRITIASFQEFRGKDFLCKGGNHPQTINARCPLGDLRSARASNASDPELRRLGPRDRRNDVAYLTQELPRFNLSYRLKSTYQFATLAVTMKIIAGDKDTTNVGCVRAELTPVLSKSNSGAMTWVPAGILIMVGLACILAAMFNPWNGTTDVFKWSSNFGMDEDMIRLVTPGFADCLHWLQFIVLTGSLTINYPGFYQAIVSKGAWCVLLLNTSFYTNPVDKNLWNADGLYAIQAWAHGYERLAEYVGLARINDIWVSVMAWFAVLLIGSVVAFQIWFWGRWLVRKATGVEEDDLTRRNWPFTCGLMCRFAFTYFLVPTLTASFFQLTNAGRLTADANIAVVVLAGIFIMVQLCVVVWLTYVIWNYRPRAALFDELPALLMFGTFYNTYREKGLKYFVVHLYTNVLRSIAFGALQPSGIAQITILAVCEIVTILTVYGIKPFASETSMNLWHLIFASIRLVTVMLMMAFIPSIAASEAVRGWVGWVILGIHAVVLIFGFALKALQTYLELALRGYKNEEEASRGGLAKVFGVRQLSRRRKRHHKEEANRESSLTATTIGTERRQTTTTFSSHRPHSQTNSSAILLNSPGVDPRISMGGLVLGPDGSQSGHAHSNSGSTAGGYTPTTPGPAGYGYLPPSDPLTPTSPVADPYFRQPRYNPKFAQRVAEGEQYSPARSRGSWGSGALGHQRGSSQSSLPTSALANQIERPQSSDDNAPTGPGIRYTDSTVTVGSGRENTDYAVREVDFYYGVRGPALSEQPVRRLRTGPADPTGPVSTAKSWIRQKLGIAKGKEERGFSVVRSARAPEQLLEAQEAVRESPPEGEIGVAVSNDNDDSSDDEHITPSSRMLEKQPESPDEPLGELDLGESLSRKPTVPRKSSKRRSRDQPLRIESQLYDPPHQRLPFGDDHDHDGEERGTESLSTMDSSILEPPPPRRNSRGDEGETGRPASVGEVQRGIVSGLVRDGRGDVRGSRAELVEGSNEHGGTM